MAGTGMAALDPIVHHLLERTIDYAIPSVMFLGVLGVGALLFRSNASQTQQDNALETSTPVSELYDDLYGGKSRAPRRNGPWEWLLRSSPNSSRHRRLAKNAGVPPDEYLRVTHWNRKLESYDYTMAAATTSKAQAAAQYRHVSLHRALAQALGSSFSEDASAISHATVRALEEAEQSFLETGQDLLAEWQTYQAQLTRYAIDQELEQMGIEKPYYSLYQKNNNKPKNNTDKTSDTSKTTHQEDTNKATSTTGTKTTVTTPTQDDSTSMKEDKKETEGNKDAVQDVPTTPSESKETLLESDDLEKKGAESPDPNDAANKDSKEADKITITPLTPKEIGEIRKEAQRVTFELQRHELNFIKSVVQALGPERAPAIRSALLGDVAARGSGGLLLALQERPLTALLKSLTPRSEDTSSSESVASVVSTGGPPRLFVTTFAGDTSASQVGYFREAVTGILRTAQPGVDQVLVVLKSGGGTVTGYGSAAGQLLRIKQGGIQLTICVEEVAASGGYMMCCVADKIIASPFAALGSIGVVQEMPNAYERLKREGIEFQTVTAGKYKRTLTPFKKVEEEDLEKDKERLEDVLAMFRGFVGENRPQLDLDAVATGEVWYGTAALDMKLCDEINTVDDTLLEHVKQGYNVYEVEYAPRRKGALRRLLLDDDDDEIADESSSWMQRSIRWIVRTVAKEVQVAAATSPNLTGSSSSWAMETARHGEQFAIRDDQAHKMKL